MATDFLVGGFILSEETVSSADVASEVVVNVSRNGRLSFHLHIENTNLVGAVRLQVNNFPDSPTLEWQNVTLSGGGTSVPISSGVNVDEFFDIETGGKCFRLLIEHTSGSGVATAIAHQLVNG